MTHSEVRAALEEYEVIPSKKLGQNFLCDQNVAKWIVDQLEITSEDTVIEVGPGTGALTEFVVPIAKKVILIEFDTRLADRLKTIFKNTEKVTVHHVDACRFDTRTLFPEGPVKFLGNLPYSSGGAILANFLSRPSLITRAVVMLQKEFIDRIVAKPRTKEYGILSLRMQAEWDSQPIKTVPPEAFYPRPLIDSTVMVVEPTKTEWPAYDHKLFDELIRRGFAQRRKMLRKAMPEHLNWTEVCEKLDIIETCRAEELDLKTWVEIARLYDNHPLKDIPQDPNEVFDVVNEKDEVIKTEKRCIVHAENLLHRAVHALVFNKRSEVFLQKRSMLKDKHPGKWDSSAAGHLDSGEDYESAVNRELNEELGITDAPLKFITKLTPSENTGWEHIGLYLAAHMGNVTYPCSEIECGQWFHTETVDEWVVKRPQDFSSGFLECWKAFKAEH